MNQNTNDVLAEIYKLMSEKEKNFVSERIKRGIARKKQIREEEKKNGKV